MPSIIEERFNFVYHSAYPGHFCSSSWIVWSAFSRPLIMITVSTGFTPSRSSSFTAFLSIFISWTRCACRWRNRIHVSLSSLIVFFCFLKCSKTCYDTFVPASSQKVSLIAEPALPAPQAIFRSDEATTGTSVIKRRASLRILIAALRSRSRTRPQSWQLKTLSARAKSACIQPQPEQVLLEGNQRSTSCTEPPYCSAAEWQTSHE